MSNENTHHTSLSDLLEALPERTLLSSADGVAITDLTCDSRLVGAGTLFVAVPGTQVDGHKFIPQAVAQGAAAVVCENAPAPLPSCAVVQVPDARRALSALADAFHGHPSRKMRMIGVTGTNGKTSTVELLREILRQDERSAGSIGTLGFCFGDDRVESDLTTPPAERLHGSLSTMHAAGLTDVCMEASSDALIQHRVSDVAFDVAVLTNITRDHLNTHGTMENYARAKRMLFEGLSDDAVAILPANEPYRPLFQSACDCPVLTYGLDRGADITGCILSAGTHGMVIEIRTPFECYELRTSLLGRHNALNILAAAASAFALGVCGSVVRSALRNFPGVPGRIERIVASGGHDLPTVCVDFAHTPDALQNVLNTLRPLVDGRLVCLIGCGGDRDRTKRAPMGRIASSLADIVVLTADNSRGERTEDIIAEMRSDLAPHSVVHVEPDRRRAIELAVQLAATPDSLAAICGRGCEKYLKIGTSKTPFDDRAVAREVLEALPRQTRKSA